MKSILVHVSGGPGQNTRIEAALDIARAFSGHITFCQPAPPPIIVSSVSPGSLWSAVEFEDYASKTEKVRADVRSAIEDKMAGEDVPWDFQTVEGFTQDAFVSQSGLVDLAVTSLEEADSPFETAEPFLSQVVVRASCPVLALPEKADGFNAFGRVLIAWDGSMEAAAAVKGALPLLKKAEDVAALSVGEIIARPGLDSLGQYLSRHGISVTNDSVPDKGHISDRLLETGRSIGANLLVMGAFGHSRLVQFILGGETERMLKQSQMAVLFGR